MPSQNVEGKRRQAIHWFFGTFAPGQSFFSA